MGAGIPVQAQRLLDRMAHEASPYLSPSRKRHRLGTQWYHVLQRQLPAGTPAGIAAPEAPAPLPVAEEEMSARNYAIAFVRSPALREAFLAARPRAALWPHQEGGVQFILAREAAGGGGIIGDEMQTGKTFMLLATILRDLQQRVAAGEPRYGRPTLIVVPKMLVGVIRRQWQCHLSDNFERPLRLRVVCDGACAEVPAHALVRDTDVVLTTYATLQAATKAREAGRRRYGALLDVHWRRVFADEAHSFNNDRILKFRIMTALRADARWFISGTPLTNHIDEVHAVFAFIGASPALSASGGGGGVDSAEFRALRDRVLLRRTRRDVAEARGDAVPVRPYHDAVVMLDFGTVAEAREYDTLASAAAAAAHISPADRLRILTCLRQLCVAPPLAGALSSRREGEDTAYEDAVLLGTSCAAEAEQAPTVFTKEVQTLNLLRTVVEPAGEKLIVYACWRGALERLDTLLRRRDVLMGRAPGARHVFVHGNIKKQALRDAAFARFTNDPQVSCLLVTMGTGGVGLSLTAANHVVLLTPAWTPATEQQAVDRVMGFAQTRPVYVYRLVMRGTIEEAMLAIKEHKEQLGAVLPPGSAAAAQKREQQVYFFDYIIGRHQRHH